MKKRWENIKAWAALIGAILLMLAVLGFAIFYGITDFMARFRLAWGEI